MKIINKTDQLVIDIAREFFNQTILSEEGCLKLSKIAVRLLMERIQLDSSWRVNRYNTDDEYVLHFWRDILSHGEQSFDIRVER